MDHHRCEPHASWLVQLLPAQHAAFGVFRSRQLAPYATSQLAASSSGRSRGCSRSNCQFHLAQLFLRRSQVVQSGNSPSRGQSILTKVKPSTGEPDAGEPLVRFGGKGVRNQSDFLTPILIVRVRSLNHSSECYWVLMTGDCPEQQRSKAASVARQPEPREFFSDCFQHGTDRPSEECSDRRHADLGR